MDEVRITEAQVRPGSLVQGKQAFNILSLGACRALMDLLKQLPDDVKRHISSLCIDGTSSTALLVDSRRGDVLAPTKIYNECQGGEAYEATKVRSFRFSQHLQQRKDGCTMLLLVVAVWWICEQRCPWLYNSSVLLIANRSMC